MKDLNFFHPMLPTFAPNAPSSDTHTHTLNIRPINARAHHSVIDNWGGAALPLLGFDGSRWSGGLGEAGREAGESVLGVLLESLSEVWPDVIDFVGDVGLDDGCGLVLMLVVALLMVRVKLSGPNSLGSILSNPNKFNNLLTSLCA